MISSTRHRANTEIARQARLSQEIARLQESISTNKRIGLPSDDPSAASRIAEIRQDQADQLIWSSNIKIGQAITTAADTTLGSVQTLLNRAKELVLSGRTDSASSANRASIAAELRELVVDLDQYSKLSDPSGRALFPTNSVLTIPVSESLSLPATAGRAQVFEQVSTAQGVRSIAQILTDSADALERADAGARNAGVDAALDALDAASLHVSAVRADQGLRAQRFDEAKERLDAAIDASTVERAGLENTDLTYALSTFQAKQLSLQAAQTVFAQSQRNSLFDLLG